MADTNTLQQSRTAAGLLDIEQLAEILNLSKRHIARLADAGRMPSPLRLGRTLRWDRRRIESWIESGCQPCRPTGRK